MIAVIGALVLFAWDRRGEQLARVGDVAGADAACEQSVMADAVKACWQDMDEEAADELVGREPHDLLPRVAIDAVILVLERDAGAAAGKQAAVGDGDAVGIARQIGQHGLGAAEGAFAVDHPFEAADGVRYSVKASRSARLACAPKNCRRPAAWVATSFSRNSRRNSRESTRTGRKKPGRQDSRAASGQPSATVKKNRNAETVALIIGAPAQFSVCAL